MLVCGQFVENKHETDDFMDSEYYLDYEKQDNRLEHLRNKCGGKYYIEPTNIEVDIPTENLYMYAICHIDSDLDNSFFVRYVYFDEKQAIDNMKCLNEEVWNEALQGYLETVEEYRDYYDVKYLSVKEIEENILKRIEEDNQLSGDNFNKYPFLSRYHYVEGE